MIEKRLKFKQTELGQIPENWEVLNIPDVANNYDSKRIPISSRKRAKIKGKYSYYGATGVLDRINDFKFEGNYLLVAEDGSVTTDGIYPMLQQVSGKFWVSNHAHVLQCDDPNDQRFLYYQLRNTDVSSFITGAVQPKLSQQNLNRIPILWARNRFERKKIADVLGALDDKIELNRKMNETLEQIGRAVFRRLFGNIENNLMLSDILQQIESGKRPKGGVSRYKTGIPSIGAENINGLAYYDKSKEKYVPEEFFRLMKKGVLKHKDILLYKDGAKIGRKGVYRNNYPYARCCVNEHVFILRVKDKLMQNYLYFWLDQPEITKKIMNLNSNAAQPGINQQQVKSLNFPNPDKKLLKKFDDMAECLLDKIYENAKENEALSQIRDLLLPRLMSGRLKVR